MKHYLLLLLLFVASANAFGQFYLGVSAGPNLSFWKWDIKPIQTDVGYEPAIGGRAAITGALQINSWITTKAAFGMQLKANKVNDVLHEDGTPAGPYHEYYQYLEGSLALEFSPLKKHRNFYLSAGLTYGWLQKAWYRATVSDGGTESTVNKDKELDYLNKNAPNLDYGIGWRFPLKNGDRLDLQLYAQHNLSALDNSDNVDAWVRSVLLQVGYAHRF